MARSIEALVKPELLVWARQSAGLDIKTAAKKIHVAPERLSAWEKPGLSKPTVKQLRGLARAYKRPLAVFYLSTPPKDFDALRDYRRLPGRVAGIMTPELIYQIRRAHNRREIALELYESTEGQPPELSVKVSLNDDPEKVAEKIRKFIGVDIQDQIRWKPGYNSLNRWKAAFERAGILVFQITGVDRDEIRGLSISETPLPAIVLNIKDSVNGRIFTLFHEFCHILLHAGGLCDLSEEPGRPPEEQATEVFCNRVAGASLIPADSLFSSGLLGAGISKRDWKDTEIQRISEYYGVSREVVVRRLLFLGLTTEAFYSAKRKQYARELAEIVSKTEGGFVSPQQMAVSSAGMMFVRLVLSSYYQDKITASDVADFLEVRLKHLSSIEGQVIRGTSGSQVVT